MSAPSLGCQLRRAREAANLSREHAAIAIGRTVWSVQAYEADRVQPPLSTLLRLAALYGVQLGELVGAEAVAR